MKGSEVEGSGALVEVGRVCEAKEGSWSWIFETVGGSKARGSGLEGG